MSKKENKSKLELTIKIEGEEWTKAVDNAFKKRVKTVEVDGFRKGKCPRDIYEKKFGKEPLYIDAADGLVNTAFTKLLSENKDVVPIVTPNVDIKNIDENGVEFIFTIITHPEIKIKNYKNLNVKKDKVQVTKEEIEHELSHLLEKYSELVTKEDGKVENGDIAIIDYEGFKDGVAFEGGKAENYSLAIGSNTFIPGFEEAIIGMKIGEEKDINLTFPEEYPSEDLKGKPVVFKVKVNEIKYKQTRKLDKDFFDDLGMEGIDSKEKLEKEIKENIKAQKEVDSENNYVNKLLEEIAKGVDVDIPEELVDEEIHAMIHHFEEQLKMQGLTLDAYYKFTNSDEAMLHSQMEKEAYQHVLYRLIIEEIMKQEKVAVTDEEVDKELKDMTEKYKVQEEMLLESIGGKEALRYELEIRKVIELIKENNK